MKISLKTVRHFTQKRSSAYFPCRIQANLHQCQIHAPQRTSSTWIRFFFYGLKASGDFSSSYRHNRPAASPLRTPLRPAPVLPASGWTGPLPIHPATPSFPSVLPCSQQKAPSSYRSLSIPHRTLPYILFPPSLPCSSAPAFSPATMGGNTSCIPLP